jgi:hypothetical protein
LEEVGLAFLHVDEDDVLFVELIGLNVDMSPFDPDFGVSQVGGDHLNGAVVSEAKKDTGREEKFGFAGRGG